jgi:YVTN family beta-propeller protein
VVDIPLPGPPVRFDTQNLDISADRLYVSHMGAGEIVVVNIRTRKVERTVGGLPGVTGVLAVHPLDRVYASVGGLHQVAVIDAHTLRVIARVDAGTLPDGLAYAPDQRKLYAADLIGGRLIAINTRTNQVADTVRLGGEPGSILFDPGSRCILVAVQTLDRIDVIDPRNERILGRFELQGAARPHGVAIDAVRRLAFVGNQSDAKVQVVDLRFMNVIGEATVGVEPDALAFDPLWRRLYVGSEAGLLSVFTETRNGLYHEGDVYIPGAHAVTVDPRTHLVYLPLANIAGQPVLRIMAGTPPRGR